MSLFPNEDILTKEIDSWKGFADNLPYSNDRELFLQMLNDCCKYASAINVMGEPFPNEPLIMALLISQHKLIEWLTDRMSTHVSLIIEPAPRQTRQQSSSNNESYSDNVDYDK